MQIKDLAENPDNPRTITDEKLALLKNALEAFGDLGGFVFNHKTKRLVGGHQRSKLFDADAKVVIETKYPRPTRTGTVAEGYVVLKGERFKYREVSWNEPTEKAANIAANKGAGEWDLPKLGEWLKDLGEFGFDLDLTMFDADERGGLIPEAPKAGLTDDDAIPKNAPTRCKLGDLWALGTHRLLCGDSTEAEMVERLMNGEKADLWLTDPPYGVDYVKKNAAVNGGVVKNAGNNKIANDEKTLEELKPFWLSAAVNAIAVCSDEAAYYWFACQGGDQMMMMMMLGEAGWLVRHELIWVKPSMVFGRCDYHYRHEPIIYGWKRKGKHNWLNDRKQTSVLEFERPHKSDLHPTTKPVELLAYLIPNNAKPADLVLDTFLGSGSTLIACEKTGRRCFGMEIDPHYCDVVLKRWEDFTGNKARKLPAGQGQHRVANGKG